MILRAACVASNRNTNVAIGRARDDQVIQLLGFDKVACFCLKCQFPDGIGRLTPSFSICSLTHWNRW